MIVIIIVLILGGFAFPPLWLALIGYLIYIFASKKSRRDEAVEKRVKAMIASGKNFAAFNELYFDAARSYAEDKGSKSDDPEIAVAKIVVDNQTYRVSFMKCRNGGTEIHLMDDENFASSMKAIEESIYGVNSAKDEQTLADVDLWEHYEDGNNFDTPPRFIDAQHWHIGRLKNEFGGGIHVPSWARSKEELDHFFVRVNEEASTLGVPEVYVYAFSLEKEEFNDILAYVAAAEREEFNTRFQEQVAACRIAQKWQQLGADDKDKMKSLTFDEKFKSELLKTFRQDN